MSSKRAISMLKLRSRHVRATSKPEPPKRTRLKCIRSFAPVCGLLTVAFIVGCPAVPPEPTVFPASGPSDGGTKITIRGLNFASDTAVLFGDLSAARITVVNSALVEAVSPAHAAGMVDIVLLGADGQDTILNAAFEFVAPVPPIEPPARTIPILNLSSVTPRTGPASGGTKVTLRGVNFAPNTAVLFGEMSAADVTFINSALIEATSPDHTAGMVDVVLLGADGQDTTLNAVFEFIAPEPEVEPPVETIPVLVVRSVTPSSGLASGGTLVTIEGSGFVEGMTAFIGLAPGVDVRFVSPGVATLTTPVNLHGPADIRLVAPDGREHMLAGGFTYRPVDPTDPGIDTDGDGLTDLQELTGRPILIDDAGFGPGTADVNLLTKRNVTSDPTLVDTDGDGLTDREEYFLQSDPSDVDTDSDGLTDEEEWARWKTSPVSIDSDGDARHGDDESLPPNAALFDGTELYDLAELSKEMTHPASANSTRVLRGRATSPSLADTDGDGKSDFEEFDDVIRSNLVADLPLVNVTFVGEIDIKLRVVYEEGESSGSEYGSSFSTTDTNSTSRSNSESVSVETAASGGFIDEITSGDGGLKAGLKGFAVKKGLELGQKAACGALDVGGETSPRFKLDDPQRIANDVQDFDDALSATADALGVCDMPSDKTTTTNTTTLTEESSRTAQEEHSRYVSESRTSTETSASGEIIGGVRIQNNSAFTFGLGSLFVTAMHWQSSPNPSAAFGAGAFRTIATLRPTEDDFFTVLAPGETTDVIEMAALDVNPAVIKELLARPTAMFYAPASLELSNQDGVNLDFVTEQVFARTATILIDYGGGITERHEVATNIDRDARGTLVGVRLGRVLRDVLEIPFETTDVDGVQVVTSIRDIENVVPADLGDPENGQIRDDPLSMWFVYFEENNLPAEDVGFEETVLRHGDVVRLLYTHDQDGDGLFAREEGLHGTLDTIADTDGDGLTDYQEVKVGWTVAIDYEDDPNADVEYRVFSSPTQVDPDGDGLSDMEERAAGLDPTNPDTDDDTLSDKVDLRPLIPSKRIYVNASVAGGDASGDSWTNAFADLQSALSSAADRNDPDDPGFDPQETVSEIWVAGGVYTPPADGFLLVDGVKLFGGFGGTELSRNARTSDPVSNGTILSGEPVDANGDYVATIVKIVDSEIGVTLDGFVIQRGGSRVTDSNGDIDLALFDFNGGGVAVSGSTATLENLWFRENYSSRGGALNVGGLNLGKEEDVVIRGCRFDANRAFRGGAVFLTRHVTAEIRDCAFSQNFTGDLDYDVLRASGGAMEIINNVNVSVENCSFVSNQVRGAGRSDQELIGGAVRLQVQVDAAFIGCSFRNNGIVVGNGEQSGRFGGAVHNDHTVTSSWVNCDFGSNFGVVEGGGLFATGNNTTELSVPTMTNCTFYDNEGGGIIAGGDVGIPVGSVTNCVFWGNGDGNLTDQVFGFDVVSNCLIDGLNEFLVLNAAFGFDNIDGDPGFVDPDGGDFGLTLDSPCIDAGNQFVDTDSVLPGFQSLPETDIKGKARVIDGDADGEAEVDIGAHEFQTGG